MMSQILIRQIEVGPMANYIHFLGNKSTKEIVVIDPAWDAGFIYKQAQKEKFKIKAILLTHGHPDHINAVDELLELCDVPVYASRQEVEFFKLSFKNLEKVDPNNFEIILHDSVEDEPSDATGDFVTSRLGGVKIKSIFTPGHTPGSMCFLASDILDGAPSTSALAQFSDMAPAFGLDQGICDSPPQTSHQASAQERSLDVNEDLRGERNNANGTLHIGSKSCLLITGDTLFLDSCGRCDLPGGSESTLYRSLREKISILPDDTLIYPGHNYHRLPFDTLGAQKESNPCLH